MFYCSTYINSIDLLAGRLIVNHLHLHHRSISPRRASTQPLETF
jgi:hypothetical protein